MSNSFDLDQAQCSVGSGLGPNCLQKLSADHTRRGGVNLVDEKTVNPDQLASSGY